MILVYDNKIYWQGEVKREKDNISRKEGIL